MTFSKFERVIHKIDPHSKLLRIWELHGGLSAQVRALEIERADGQRQKMIVRQHGEKDRQQNPYIAADEFKLLRLLQSLGLAVPKPYHVDESGEIFATPYIVIEYVEGKTEFASVNVPDFILQMAVHLSRIHAVDGARLDLAFLPKLDQKYADKLRERPPRVDDSLDEGRIRDVLEAVFPLTQRNKPVLLHGDFWPGNIIWKDGQLAAVIDWEDAQLGDPMADLAVCRLEMLWALGSEAMESFTQHYRSMTKVDFIDLPYWDLCAALRPAFELAEWAGDALIEKRMRDRHRWFVTQAFEKL